MTLWDKKKQKTLQHRCCYINSLSIFHSQWGDSRSVDSSSFLKIIQSLRLSLAFAKRKFYFVVFFMWLPVCSTHTAILELAHHCLDQDLFKVWNAYAKINPAALNNLIDAYYRYLSTPTDFTGSLSLTPGAGKMLVCVTLWWVALCLCSLLFFLCALPLSHSRDVTLRTVLLKCMTVITSTS